MIMRGPFSRLRRFIFACDAINSALSQLQMPPDTQHIAAAFSFQMLLRLHTFSPSGDRVEDDFCFFRR